MVEKFRVTAIEFDMARRTGVSLLPGHRMSLRKQGFGHSWATSFA
jgi:hypothetical protein